MAWRRDEANLNISGATAYSYTECDWSIGETACTYRHIGGVTSPYGFNAQATAEGEWWEGSWHDYSPAVTGSGTFGGYGDLALFDITDSFARAAQDRVVSVGTSASMMGGSARSYIDYTVPHLAPAVTWASSDPVVRNSDNSITLKWNAPALEYSAMCLEVSIDGGSWSQFAVLWNTATTYTWTECSADHSYQFRIRSNYLASYSAYDTCATVILMTPAAPQSISTAAAGGTNITVNLVNPSPVATKVQYEVSTDDGATWGATQDSASLTSFSVSASGTVKIRVRNYNATGTSAWLTSDTVTTICPPAKPTITSPQTGAWDVSQPLDVAWLHNSLDGSAQEAYKLRVAKLTPPLDSHTETYSPSTASTQSITWADVRGWLPTLALGDKIAVGIATKGADASYSSFGISAGITPYTAPTLSITSPSATVTGMPIGLAATYSDMAGFTCQAATVSLQKDGRTLFSEPATINGSSITASLDVTEFLPTNGETYTVVVTARSSSSLQTSANATFLVDFVEPQAGELSIVNDPETGYASLLATFDNSASEVEYSGDTNEQYDSAEGYVRSLTVEGKSAKWNQLTSAAVTSGSSDTVYGITSTKNADGSTSYSGTASGVPYSQFPLRNAGVAPICSLKRDGTKYFCFVNKDLGRTIGLIGFGVNFGRTEFLWSNTAGGTWTAAISVDMPDDTVFNVSNVYQFIIDLTAIYGAGNEPTTLDDPRIAWLKAYALAHPTYDAGSLVSIEGAGVVGRNLSPFFAHSFTDTAYWDNLATTRITQGEDGWAHIVLDNTGASGTMFANWFTKAAAKPLGFKPSTDYTFVIEVKNGTYNQTCYIAPDSYYAAQLSMFGSTGSFTISADGTYYRTVMSRDDLSVASLFNRGYFAVNPNGKFEADVRISVYEGTYTGAFEPYIAPTTITAPLRSAGSVHDTLTADADSWTVERRVGVVDLGTLTWGVNSLVSTIYYAQVPNMYVPTDALGRLDGILCANYAVDTVAQLDSNMGNKTMKRAGGNINIRDDSYSTKEAFKAAMSGVYLFYELATPTTDPETSMSTIEIGTAFMVATDLDSTFAMTTWDGSADAVSISVSRVNADDTLTPLITDGASGSGVVDKYAPLNTPYQYAVTTKANTQAVKTVYVDNELVTDLWFAYWTHRDGDTVTEMTASAKWNPDNGGIQVTRPQKTRVYYAGRRDPVSYDGHAVALTETPSWMFIEQDEVRPFVQLIEDGGRGVYKSCDGWVYHADFDLTMTPSYTAIGYYGGASLGITRIAGDRL